MGCLGLEPPVAKPQPLLVTAHAALEMPGILNTWVPKESFPCPIAGLEAHIEEMLNFMVWYKRKGDEVVHDSSAKEGSLWSGGAAEPQGSIPRLGRAGSDRRARSPI